MIDFWWSMSDWMIVTKSSLSYICLDLEFYQFCKAEVSIFSYSWGNKHGENAFVFAVTAANGEQS